jgi:hypothetical protein
VRIMKKDEVPEMKLLARRYRWKHLVDAIVSANGQWVLVEPDDYAPASRTLAQTRLSVAGINRKRKIQTSTKATDGILARLIKPEVGRLMSKSSGDNPETSRRTKPLTDQYPI